MFLARSFALCLSAANSVVALDSASSVSSADQLGGTGLSTNSFGASSGISADGGTSERTSSTLSADLSTISSANGFVGTSSGTSGLTAC